MNRFQKKTPVWESISRSLTADIAEGRYGPGDKLPTEAELSSRFGVNRHTVRHALKDMAESGLVHSRRGSGVFVAQTPTDYPIGKRVRFHRNLQQSGRLPSKQTLSVETRAADLREAEALQLNKGDPVHVYEGLSLADGQPICVFKSAFPADRFPEMLDHITFSNSVTAALNACGILDYTRISTRLTAKRATATQALHLRIQEGDPILRTVGINVDPDGNPIEYGVSWFAGDRVTLTLAEADAP
ncbi:phosphonate metabolism transcriptional regulator PhnF [Shimia sp. CNT1-13L.2]|uniref:phosphonate metabolism transcriptional regulator PhnF n=1 Tax=Shimia sp. CNT1-13L.2 TaxID=2959663 RepID=UPI0020CC7B25|nr:phosphonate metabolism transcriptional regulator PhnF [Shimia sp. CNT1-13L.2]MCP9482798.1 phosphonate metabolism transcriptional regulator PhnF [Shimia sp. CNT1-13L.2]